MGRHSIYRGTTIIYRSDDFSLIMLFFVIDTHAKRPCSTARIFPRLKSRQELCWSIVLTNKRSNAYNSCGNQGTANVWTETWSSTVMYFVYSRYFCNLARNCSKFCDRAFIRLRAEVIDELVQLSVEDSGPRIPENKRGPHFTRVWIPAVRGRVLL